MARCTKALEKKTTSLLPGEGNRDAVDIMNIELQAVMDSNLCFILQVADE